MKKGIKVICCLMLILWGIWRLSILTRPVDVDMSINAIDTFHQMPENTMEVMVYGSSHAWCGLDVNEMYKSYGIGAYNYGCNWQHINTTQLFFHDSLETQTPKVILIETFRINELLQDLDMQGEIYYTTAIPYSRYKWNYLKQCFGNKIERFLSYHIPLLAFHENWLNLSEKNFMEQSDFTDFYASKGFLGAEGIQKVTIGDWTSFEQAELSENAKVILDDIVETCKAKGIDIVFFTVPYEGKHSYISAVEQYAQKNGCAYLNLFQDMKKIGINPETDFVDKGHLNIHGAAKVADYLGEYLFSHYDLKDMRTVPDNIWEKSGK